MFHVNRGLAEAADRGRFPAELGIPDPGSLCLADVPRSDLERTRVHAVASHSTA